MSAPKPSEAQLKLMRADIERGGDLWPNDALMLLDRVAECAVLRAVARAATGYVDTGANDALRLRQLQVALDALEAHDAERAKGVATDEPE